MFDLKKLLQPTPYWSPASPEEYMLLVPLPTKDGEKHFFLKVEDVPSLTSREIWNLFFVFGNYREQRIREIVVIQNLVYSEFEKFYRTPPGSHLAKVMRTLPSVEVVKLVAAKYTSPVSRLFITTEADIRKRAKIWIKEAHGTGT